jgi:hypothetical protein
MVSDQPKSQRVDSELPVYANGSIVQGEVFTANSLYSSAYGAQAIVKYLIGLLHGQGPIAPDYAAQALSAFKHNELGGLPLSQTN